MKRLVVLLLLVAALAASIAFLVRPTTQASPDVTITVNSTADTNVRDSVMTLREAMLMATGDLFVTSLSYDECQQVSGASWSIAWCMSPVPIGDGTPETIVFGTAVFPPGSPATIAINNDDLPPLSTGNDIIDASSAGVIIELFGGGAYDCFRITSDNNTVKGLEMYQWHLGVRIEGGAHNNIVGGSGPGEGNVISGGDVGVGIVGSGTDGNVVKGNFIGTDASGTAAVPNSVGVQIGSGAQGNIIGGSGSGEGNVISGNLSEGVRIDCCGTNNNVLKGNFIGTDASGTAAVPNGSRGVWISGSQDNTIGGTAAGEGNVIAYNAWRGVAVYGDATGNTIRGNSIHDNIGKGIENTDGGNTELAVPTITGFGSVMGTACANCTIDVYSDDADEGRVYEGSTTANGAGTWSFSGSLEGPNVTATATDANGNTSEFSAPVAVPEPTPTPSPTPTPTRTPTPTPSPPPGATPTPAGPTRTLQWGPGWHNATWSGASTPEQAFACAAGKYAAAYRFTDAGLERYFPDRPDISNMGPLNKYNAFLILITQPVTCAMPVAAASGSSRTLQWGIGWQNEGWSGADGTAPQQAFACADGSYAAAYRFTEAGLERYFPARPDISNMGPLNKYDAFLILVTAPVSCFMPTVP